MDDTRIMRMAEVSRTRVIFDEFAEIGDKLIDSGNRL
jgi:hypothetical protein